MTVADAACPAATTFALRFHLSPPQRHSRSGSIFLRRNENRPPARANENKKGVAGTVTPFI